MQSRFVNSFSDKSLVNDCFCPICGKDEESIVHALFLCEHTGATWFGSKFGYLSHNTSFNSISEWWKNNMETNDSIEPKFNIDSKVWILALWKCI